MNGSDDSTGELRLRIIADQDSRAFRRNMRAAMDRLTRLEEIMLEMLCAGAAGAAPFRPDAAESHPSERPVPAGCGTIAGRDPRHGALSRKMLDDLARHHGQPPLCGLWLIEGGAACPASARGRRQAAPPPLYLRIDRHLRLCLEASANRVGVEHLDGTHWRDLDLAARKDGRGGVALDPAALERRAGPLSPELRRMLRLRPGQTRSASDEG